MMIPEIAVLMTCHNRANTTVACLDALHAQNIIDKIKLSVFLVDDGSTDGTAKMVHEKYPQVNIIMGDGSLFWNRGMYRAFGEALNDDFDYYLWLNDDTTLRDDALDVLIQTHQYLAIRDMPASIVIASTKDPVSSEFTYGGYRQKRRYSPLSLMLTPPADEPIYCDTFCGNVVLIPRQVAIIVGNIDPVFEHRWGDVDYGLRAKRLGCKCWIAPGYHAECAKNPKADRWRDRKLPFKEKIRDIYSIKGLSKYDWKIYVHRHGGVLWPLMWIRPYARLLYDAIKPF